jgi:hypothetical protein
MQHRPSVAEGVADMCHLPMICRTSYRLHLY